ncbi:pre-mRNA-splicing ATP-dependent RNA helicase Prp28p [Diutina rugosa]
MSRRRAHDVTDLPVKKPKFLNKRQREQLKSSSAQPSAPVKPQKPHSSTPHRSVTLPDEKHGAASPVRGDGNAKFKFDWNNDEDTWGDVELIGVPETASNSTAPKTNNWRDKPLSEMTPRDWRIMKEEFHITTKGEVKQPKLIRYWSETELDARLLHRISQLGYTNPTPIQRVAVPIAIAHDDVLGVAATGSGKTLAFSVPLIQYLVTIDSSYLQVEYQRPEDKKQALSVIIAPTRELALQISENITALVDGLGFNVVTLIGGHGYEGNLEAIKKGAHIVVATPGRLVDALERQLIRLDHCYYLILDEADRMVDMGFEPAMTNIVSQLPSEKQLQSTIDTRIFKVTKRTTLMFTATMSPAIERLTQKYLVKPTMITVSAETSTPNIDQHFEYVDSSETNEGDLDTQRVNLLIKILRRNSLIVHSNLVIIFCNLKSVCDEVSGALTAAKIPNTVIHGSKSQESREEALRQFTNHEVNVLVATDVAARGIDIPNVTAVVNFQMPSSFPEYIHRIGRTGRAGNTGSAWSFVDENDSKLFGDLRKHLRQQNCNIPSWLSQADSQIVD